MRLQVVVLLFVALFEWILPSVGAAQPLVVLMPGGKGAPQAGGFLMRNKGAFDRAGFETLVSSTPPQTVQAARRAKAEGQKVFIVGMSIGVIKSAAALGAGAPADGAVFFSGNYEMARMRLGSPSKLPPTLLVHHRDDTCPGTTPNNVEPFRQWASGRVERIVWIQTSASGRNSPPCGAVGAHGFFKKDQEPISAAINFIKAH